MDVNILGSKWKIRYRKLSDDTRLEDIAGYCDPTIRTITIRDYEEDDYDSKGIIPCEGDSEDRAHVMRHELIHAFLYESGLGEHCDWAKNEEAVDWLAWQFPKLRDLFAQVRADSFGGGLFGRDPNDTNRQRRVFVCSPYRGNVSENVMYAAQYCRYIYEIGDLPIAPHLYFPEFLDDSKTTERDAAIDMGLQLLELCDEIHVLGEPTAGMRKEIEHAKLFNIPIKYYDENGRATVAA